MSEGFFPSLIVNYLKDSKIFSSVGIMAYWVMTAPLPMQLPVTAPENAGDMDQVFGLQLLVWKT